MIKQSSIMDDRIHFHRIGEAGDLWILNNFMMI